ncbi:hypothetical protein BASA81_015056 [Batrachochytrium salamandrivorans]|nr:hypothetical protein BASA81_015056 [Batrachochytrium salamandrivorans]
MRPYPQQQQQQQAYSRMPQPPPYIMSSPSNNPPIPISQHYRAHHHHSPPPRKPSSPSSRIIVLNPQILIIFLFFLLACLVIALSMPGVGGEGGKPLMAIDPGRGLREDCHTVLDTERRIKDELMDQVRRLEMEVGDLRLKNRELESDYRELSLSARAQAVPVQSHTKPVMEDVSAVQRLAKCRSNLEESAGLIKELRDGNKQVNAQVTRLQKELREAISDADEQEAIALACQKKLKK